VLEKRWESFKDVNKPKTFGSLFRLAKQHGWKPHAVEPEETTALIKQLNQTHFMLLNIVGKCMVGEIVKNQTGLTGEVLLLCKPNNFKIRYANQRGATIDERGNLKWTTLSFRARQMSGFGALRKRHDMLSQLRSSRFEVEQPAFA
jgi:hypothetical protein